MVLIGSVTLTSMSIKDVQYHPLQSGLPLLMLSMIVIMIMIMMMSILFTTREDPAVLDRFQDMTCDVSLQLFLC